MINEFKSIFQRDYKDSGVAPKTKKWMEQTRPLLFERSIERFTKNKISSSLSYLFEMLLSCIDGDTIDEHDDALMFFTEYGKDASLSMYGIMDPIRNGAKYGYLLKQDPPVPEYYVPVSSFSYIRIINECGEDKNKWKNLKPIRIWSHDSEELQLDFVKGYITYKNDPPSYVMTTVDCGLLVLQFFQYVKSHGKYDPSMKAAFVSNVLIRSLIFDLCDVWFIRFVQRIVGSEDLVDFKDIVESFDVKTTFIASGVSDVGAEINNLLSRVGKFNLTPVGFLNTIPLPAGGTLGDRMRYSLENIDLPSVTQLRPYLFMRDMDTINTLLPLYEYAMSSAFQRYRELTYKLDITLQNRYIGPRVWETVKDPEMKMFIENAMEDLAARVDISEHNA